VTAPQDNDDPNTANARPKRWRILCVLFGLLAVAMGFLGMYTPGFMGFVFLAISLICMALAATAFLEG